MLFQVNINRLMVFPFPAEAFQGLESSVFCGEAFSLKVKQLLFSCLLFSFDFFRDGFAGSFKSSPGTDNQPALVNSVVNQLQRLVMIVGIDRMPLITAKRLFNGFTDGRNTGRNAGNKRQALQIGGVCFRIALGIYDHITGTVTGLEFLEQSGAPFLENGIVGSVAVPAFA